MFDQDLPKCNNPQRDFLLVANVDLVVKAPVMAVSCDTTRAVSAYPCRYARASSPGDWGLLELPSPPHSQLNSFLSASSKGTVLMLFLASLNKDPRFLRSQGKELGLHSLSLILLWYYSCRNYSVFLLLNCYVPSYFSSCP